ncbi:MAG: hypothetical protein DHS20C17_25820 [Cyclobacteriaceae bacterium]|nr:MAG: hypothetical protein DHS20C17_25820 [Cyclobacteriaceae bacterium]
MLNSRRQFIKAASSYSLMLSSGPLIGMSPLGQAPGLGKSAPGYRITLEVCTRLFDGKQCWTHPRAGIVPAAGVDGGPRVVMTMNTLDLEGSDVFKGMYGLHSDNLGKSWTEPERLKDLDPRSEIIDGVTRPVAVSDFWPKYHKASGKLLGTGHTVVYTPDWKVAHPRPRHTSFSVYAPENNQWSAWDKLMMPDSEYFHDAGAGCTQRYDLADGNILLPTYFRPPGKNSRVTIVRCSFDGSMLQYLEHGNVLEIDDETRGLHEPSLTQVNGTYYLTIRNDKKGFVTKSADGLNFEPIRPWTFDDGTELGNYNTQQHWVTHNDALYLVYTRRGANNDHVFRNRAPLFMSRVDPERLCVIRETEQILVPERGARLGNFGVTEISPEETWVTVSEWMQPAGVEKYGSDGSVYVARILWD